jgi:hypothetical protein
MLDPQIVKFYNDIKDPQWPDISSYNDYLSLPSNIQDEGNTVHDFQKVKSQICDPEHWIENTLSVCVYKNLAYVPLLKCAYVYHTNLFTNLGWKKVLLKDLDIDNTVFFGTIMHPLSRYLKGITQWITDSYMINQPQKSIANPWIYDPYVPIPVDWTQLFHDVSTKYFRQLIANAIIGDAHSMPYHLTLGKLVNKVNWIPMDTMSDHDVLVSMKNFFQLHNHNIQLPLNSHRLHESSKEQKILFNLIKNEFFNQPDNIYNFYKTNGSDLSLYYNLLDNFTPTWQHI